MCSCRRTNTHTQAETHPSGKKSSWGMTNADPRGGIRPSFWCSLLTLRTPAPTLSLHTLFGTHPAPSYLDFYSLHPVVTQPVCVCVCVQTQGFLSSSLRALQVLSPWKQGVEEEGKDVDFLTPSVPRDTNCQQLCTFVRLGNVCMRVTGVGILCACVRACVHLCVCECIGLCLHGCFLSPANEERLSVLVGLA